MRYIDLRLEAFLRMFELGFGFYISYFNWTSSKVPSLAH